MQARHTLIEAKDWDCIWCYYTKTQLLFKLAIGDQAPHDGARSYNLGAADITSLSKLLEPEGGPVQLFLDGANTMGATLCRNGDYIDIEGEIIGDADARFTVKFLLDCLA